MFGGTKPTFGTSTTGTGFGGFSNTTTSSPFGQSAFGKPTSSAFGAAPAFGTQQQTPSLFGANAAQPQPTGLFGAASTTSAFGGTTTAQPAFGGFQQTTQTPSMFGAPQPAANTSSLFGQSTTSAFGSAVKPGTLGGFGQTTAQPTPSLFGQPAAATSTSGFGSFGQAQPTTSNVFGSGTTMMMGANAGTSIAKYQPTIGTDTLMKAGQPNNVNTKQHCITAMKEYEGKSLEELRLEDYMANRKGPQAGTSGATSGFFGSTTQPAASGTGLFGATAQPTTGLFGQPAAATTENKGLFGGGAFGQTNTTAFGAQAQQNTFLAKPFGAPATTGFGGATTDSSNLFGAKPAFGQAQPSMFGQTSTATTAPAFGQTTSGFGGFGGAQPAQQTSLFGAPAPDANKPAFGLGTSSAATTGFGGFGTAATSTAGPGLFGAKPAATGFGAAPGFGATSTANTGFTNFSLGNASGGLFNSTLNKPATSGFGAFGAQTSAAPLNFNTGSTGTSLFGNAGAKPGGLFGTSLGQGTANQAGGLFGSGGTTAFGTGSTLGGGFGTGTLGGGNMSLGGLGGNQQQQQPPIHQQILAKVTSPYGDNPIFKDLKRSDETDATRATNPAAQKAILETTMNQFKVSTRSSPSVVRVKPITSALTKKSLFEGLEEFDSSVETFSLKPNAKRLIIKPKTTQSPIVGSSTNTSPNRQSGVEDTAGNSAPRQTGGVVQNSINALRNESFSGQIPLDPPAPQVTKSTAYSVAALPPQVARESDIGRRESWLHPNNVEKMRQQNLNTSIDGAVPLNSTLSELVPRKPLDTYRTTGGSSTGTPLGRPSVSTVQENTLEEQTSRETSRREAAERQDESLFSNRSYGGDERSVIEETAEDYEEHPTGITLRRIGYYTIPSLDDLKSYLAEDGSCTVPNFTVGREGYGNVYFGKEMDVAGLNLDEIVHFRNKEIIIYPDDDNKPPIGSGLNREAQVTLDQVWPHDKTMHEPIKDPVRLADMDWEGKLRRVCDRNDTRFIEYRPETGSWVFRVKHFSKYGLNDSDEEDDGVPTDPKKAKMVAAGTPSAKTAAAGQAAQGKTATVDKITMAALKNAQKISEDAARALDPKSIAANTGSYFPMDESAEFMLMDKTQFLQANGNDYALYEAQQQQVPRVTSPTAFLAREAGTDAHKLQLMKASFFGDDDLDNKSVDVDTEQENNYDYNRNHNRRGGLFAKHIHDGRGSQQTLWKEAAMGGGALSEASSQLDFVMQDSPLPPSSSVSVLSILREVDTEGSTPAPDSETAQPLQLQKLPPFTVKPKVASVKVIAHQVPMAESLAFKLNGKWVADLGLHNFRRFKPGFGPQNTLIVPSTRQNLDHEVQNKHLYDVSSYLFKGRGSKDFSKTILQHIKISSVMHYEHFKESIVKHLELQLRNSLQEDVEGSECPWIKSNNGTDLIVKHLDEAIKQINLGPLEEYAVSVWSLCLALWGEHEELDGREPTSHFAVMCRRNLLSEWLENTLTDKDLLTKNVSKHTYLDHLLELVMCHKVTEACELAVRYDDVNLALLLSQLSSGPTVRQLMEDQLAAWHKDEADKFIQLERLKLYMLVAGVALMDSGHGPINTLDGIEWTKVLAIQLWYISSPTASITDALLAYEKSFKSKEFYSLPPTPCYMDNTNFNEKYTLYDLRYHLLQLFSKRSHPMESLLNPATHTADPMDYRLSWLLLQTLEAIGYRHCSVLSESQLHVGFASQLENYDLWEWAIFVLLHIKDRNQRELSVQNALYRYVSVSKDVALSEKEKFVINNLGVPEKWIDYAKAVKAGAIGNHHLQAKYLLKAKQWPLAHEVIFQHIAPDAIINDNLDYLHSLLCQFEGAESNKTIKVPNWSNQGQIFLDFIDINEKFKGLKTLKTEADIEARWENLKPQLADLCSRINLLPCPTAKHRLCQSEIAQNLACLVRGVLLVCPVLNPCLIIKIALERLPLPQEFAQQELRALLDTLVDDLAKVSASENNELIMVK
ncbi:nuclear pore complex protein Nup98-Nup96 [Ceratitis capitata]|uniref:nuclear pore complex protein Nup98-Nup96 n=1 Tax=Ceratitis capitata TaxID=7213 RepID=UPI000329FDDD|nr:nuclear pore complex protein Nup98-Nup96 [Ceratitis capitata]XP_020717818.1 nuclear pore complex protein Nup98-Nup96 [Ceratitis capitata]